MKRFNKFMSILLIQTFLLSNIVYAAPIDKTSDVKSSIQREMINILQTLANKYNINLAPFSIAEAVGLRQDQLEKLSAMIKGTQTLRGRAYDFEEDFVKRHVERWLEKAIRYSRDQKYQYDITVMKRAYEIAMRNTLERRIRDKDTINRFMSELLPPVMAEFDRASKELNIENMLTRPEMEKSRETKLENCIENILDEIDRDDSINQDGVVAVTIKQLEKINEMRLVNKLKTLYANVRNERDPDKITVAINEVEGVSDLEVDILRIAILGPGEGGGKDRSITPRKAEELTPDTLVTRANYWFKESPLCFVTKPDTSQGRKDGPVNGHAVIFNFRRSDGNGVRVSEARIDGEPRKGRTPPVNGYSYDHMVDIEVGRDLTSSVGQFIEAINNAVAQFQASVLSQKTIPEEIDLKHSNLWDEGKMAVLRDYIISGMTPAERLLRANPFQGGVGAIRANGEELEASAHGTRTLGNAAYDRSVVAREASINGVIARKFDADTHGDTVYSLYATGVKAEGDTLKPLIKISTFAPDIQTKIRLIRDKLVESKKSITCVIIKGLKEELVKVGIAPDLLFHPGITRRAIYLDEVDFLYLLSLENGVDLFMEAINHEMAHIENSDKPEEEIEKMAPSLRVRLAFAMREMAEIDRKLESAQKNEFPALVARVRNINLWMSYIKSDEKTKKMFEEALIQRSDLAKRFSGMLIKDSEGNKDILDALTVQSIEDMGRHIDIIVKSGKITASQGEATLNTAKKYLAEWLDPKNNIPIYIRQGVYRGMLEGRFGDIMYAYGFGWRQFGTAGIRNQAVQSEFEIILQKELKEFAENRLLSNMDKELQAPILTGPNLINSVTLLQQAAALAKLTRDIRTKIVAEMHGGKDIRKAAKALGIDAEFAQNILDNTITIAYDSRLNGQYFGHLLAAAFLRQGIKVNLFDAPAGVPAGAAAAKGASFFGDLAKDTPFADVKGSMFGILVSASHSEAWYNGFKAFLGYQKSQVDADTKEMIMRARAEVGYEDFNLDLDTGFVKDLDKILKGNNENLTWFGGEEQNKRSDYLGARFIPFYPLYFEYLSRRSPIQYDKLTDSERRAIEDVKKKMKVLYTAFYGVGATTAADLPGFFSRMGYGSLDLVNAQTKVMDGTFPGHIMPDPGVVEGWMSNFFNYLMDNGLNTDPERAVQKLNEKLLMAATDPDIDRAGMMLHLPKGAKGNVKEAFIEWMKRWFEEQKAYRVKGELLEKERVRIMTALESLDDKLLLTANEAWTFMAYYKLAMREKYESLDRNKAYILLKSHVTTDGLENVAALYQKKGYNIYAVNTYVGFTELAKKGRDLFDIAKTAWQIKGLIESGQPIDEALELLKSQNETLKSNVPYHKAGLPLVDRAIEMLDNDQRDEVKDLLGTISHMEIVIACEESNGYGELGEYVPEKDEVVNAHISEKDGGLALYEFFEILAYGQAVNGKPGYEMLLDMLKEIGHCSTDNQFLKYPGLTGVQEKTDSIESLEKMFAVSLQKELDSGRRGVTLFNGKYVVEKVTICRDKKYDVSYNGFPEEGVSLTLKTRKGSTAIVTFRPSGTGDSNRVYSWIIGQVPPQGADIEEYRHGIDAEVEELRRDFFGVFGTETGYADLPKEQFYGLLTALKEARRPRHREIFAKVADFNIDFTPAEERLQDAAMTYTFATRQQDFAHMKNAERKAALANVALARKHNHAAWTEYLNTPEARNYSKKFKIYVGDRLYVIPNSLVKPLMASLSGFMAMEILSKDLIENENEIDSFDKEVTDAIRWALKEGRGSSGTKVPVRTPSREEILTLVRQKLESIHMPRADIERHLKTIADNWLAYSTIDLRNTSDVLRIAVDENKIQEDNITVVMVQDASETSDAARLAIQHGQELIREHLGEEAFIGIRGEGSRLLNDVRAKVAALQRSGKKFAVVASGSHMPEETRAELLALIKDANAAMENKEGHRPMSALLVTEGGEMAISAIQDLSLRIGFNLEGDILEFLQRNARTAAGEYFSADDLKKVFEFGILTLKPIRPINLEEVNEVHKAEAAVLRSM